MAGDGKRLTLNGIRRQGRDNCQKVQRFVNKKVCIWSREHQAWWRPKAAGYTVDAEHAWVLDFEEAYYRTAHCGPEKQIEYTDAVRGATK